MASVDYHYSLAHFVLFQRKSGGVKGLSNELMQLRKICQHPFLFESVEDKISPGGYIDDKLVRTSGKIELLHRVLPKFFATGHRVSSLVLGPRRTINRTYHRFLFSSK